MDEAVEAILSESDMASLKARRAHYDTLLSNGTIAAYRVEVRHKDDNKASVLIHTVTAVGVPEAIDSVMDATTVDPTPHVGSGTFKATG